MKLSCRRGTELQGELVSYGQKWKTGSGGQYLRTSYVYVYIQPLVFDQQSNRIRWKTQNKGYYAVQDHSWSSRLVSIQSPYAISY